MSEREKELRRTLSSPKVRRALADRDLQRPYPKLDRQKRRAVRRIFLFGILHPDAMHYAIWGINEGTDGELAGDSHGHNGHGRRALGYDDDRTGEGDSAQRSV